MKTICMDCGSVIGYNDTEAAVELVKAHIQGCLECNPKIRDLGTVECGCLYAIDGHMCKCIEIESVCNPREPYKGEQRMYTFQVLSRSDQ